LKENKKENASGKMLAIDFCVKSAASHRKMYNGFETSGPEIDAV
jgi:hypothetical protein